MRRAGDFDRHQSTGPAIRSRGRGFVHDLKGRYLRFYIITFSAVEKLMYI
jgi:hypothetical protein